MRDVLIALPGVLLGALVGYALGVAIRQRARNRRFALQELELRRQFERILGPSAFVESDGDAKVAVAEGPWDAFARQCDRVSRTDPPRAQVHGRLEPRGDD